jgi:hypothetical protein
VTRVADGEGATLLLEIGRIYTKLRTERAPPRRTSPRSDRPEDRNIPQVMQLYSEKD